MSSPGAIAFQLGPIVIRWYGILMATAIVVGLWLGYRQAKREGLPADDIISAGQWAILAGLAGARIYEVIFNWDEISDAMGFEFTQPDFEEIMSTHYGRMVHLDDETVLFANPEDAAEYIDFDLKVVDSEGFRLSAAADPRPRPHP